MAALAAGMVAPATVRTIEEVSCHTHLAVRCTWLYDDAPLMVVPAWLLSTARLHPAPSARPLGASSCASTPKLRRTKSAPSQRVHHQL